jgi:polyadenylate-binding protein
LDTLNNVAIKGRPCRIMWSQRDPSIRKSGVGNIFIKNLDTSIDHKQLYDTFSMFGNILSCKVALNEDGNSKGYGFVHFESSESAEKSIAKLNGMLIGSMKIYVGRFIPKKDWQRQKENSWTNVFCKNLPFDFTDQKLADLFKEFGTITSAVVMKAPEAPPKKVVAEPKADAADGEKKDAAEPAKTEEAPARTSFGFVNFKNHDDARKAVEAVNAKPIEGREVYCGRAQKKAERQNELRRKFEQLKMERMTKYQGINLYIKNLEDDVTEERLRKEFGAFGKIKSVKIMEEKGVSRGFGFVCFTTPEEAQRAMAEMNGRILPGCTKPLYVNLHEPQELRRQKLAAQYAARAKGVRPTGPGMAGPLPGQQVVPGAGVPGYGGAAPVFYPQGPVPGQGFVGYPPNMMPRGAARWGPAPAGQPGAAGQQFPGQQLPPGAVPNYMQQMPQRGPGPQRGGRGGPQGQPQGQGQRGGRGPQQRRDGQQSEQPAAAPAAAAPAHHSAIPQPAKLSVQQIQQFPPDQQKMLVGEQLYYLILSKEPERAGKITGMLLDAYPDQLISLLEHEDALNEKIAEAVKVLDEAQKKAEAQ